MKRISLICCFLLMLGACSKEAATLGPYFFPTGTETVTYTAYIDGNPEGVAVTARLVDKGIYMNGSLYALVFDAPIDLTLGDLFLYDRKIHIINPADMQDVTLVCSDEDNSFSRSDEETGYYEEMSWEDGVGLIKFSRTGVEGRADFWVELVRN